jgi:hypothetical protein
VQDLRLAHAAGSDALRIAVVPNLENRPAYVVPVPGEERLDEMAIDRRATIKSPVSGYRLQSIQFAEVHTTERGSAESSSPRPYHAEQSRHAGKLSHP